MIKRLFTYMLFISVLATVACTDDDSFSASTSNQLTFSADTVSLDTIFSRIPSVTKTFWVYNNSSDGIRCSSIRLKNGNQTGFRVNVNGVYLGNAQGYQISDEEVRKGDSLRVFVEATTPTNNQLSPQKVSDDLIFILESGKQQSVNLNVWSWDAELLRDVVISHDSIIASEKPTVIYGGITVSEGATLTIPAGKTLYFHDNAGIKVHGRLLCKGEPGNEVTLRGDRLDRMFDYLPYDGVSGQWRGISFSGTSYGNELSFTDIHATCDAITCDSSDVSRPKLSMKASTVHNAKGAGITAFCSNISLENCQVSNTLNSSLNIFGGATSINNCTVAQFYPLSADRGPALSFTNVSGDYAYPITALNVRNSIITGYGEDVIMGSFNDSIPVDYLFDHCLLRTPALDDSLRCRDVIWEDVEDTTIASWKNFRKVDIDLLQYDFRLKTGSLAIQAADPSTSLPTDRNAVMRDEKPDMGCYESEEESETEKK